MGFKPECLNSKIPGPSEKPCVEPSLVNATTIHTAILSRDQQGSVSQFLGVSAKTDGFEGHHLAVFWLAART